MLKIKKWEILDSDAAIPEAFEEVSDTIYIIPNAAREIKDSIEKGMFQKIHSDFLSQPKRGRSSISFSEKRTILGLSPKTVRYSRKK